MGLEREAWRMCAGWVLCLLIALAWPGHRAAAQIPAMPGPHTTNRAVVFDGTWITDASLHPSSPPMTPAAKAAFDAIRPQDDPGARCVELGTSRFMRSPSPMQIVAMDNHILLVLEYYHAVRRIWTDAKQHDSDPDPSFYGDSVVKWDGDTMVVDTVGYNGEQWLDAYGHPASTSMHIVERWTLVNKDKLSVEFTFDDPKNYTHPWKQTVAYDHKPKWKLSEMSCDHNRNDPTDPNNPKDFTSTDKPSPYVAGLPPGPRPK